MPSFTIPFLHCSGSSIKANAIRHEKDVKGIQIEKEEIQLSVHRWHDHLRRKYKKMDKKTAETNNQL